MKRPKLSRRQHWQIIAFNGAVILILGPIIWPIGLLLWIFVSLGKLAERADEALSAPIERLRYWVNDRIIYGPKKPVDRVNR